MPETLEVARGVQRDLVGRLLPPLDHAFPTAVLREVTQFLAETSGAEHVSLWLGDYDQDLLGGLSVPAGVDIDERIAVGDSPIDYFAVDADRLWVAGISAMGHGVNASVLAALTSHTLRNARRRGADLVEQVDAADRALVEVFGGDQFVTALVAEVDLDSGRCRIVNAGHPSLLLLRRGTVRALADTANVPMGLFTDSTFAAIDTQLHPGDPSGIRRTRRSRSRPPRPIR